MDIVDRKCGDVESRILKSMMQDKGIFYLSKNIPLTEVFIKNNADQFRDTILWRNMLLCQRHINPYFFDRFFTDMDETTQNILSRKKVMFDLVKLLKRV
jgi:hypothetical protein